MTPAGAPPEAIDLAVMLREAAALAGDLRAHAASCEASVRAALSSRQAAEVDDVFAIGDGDSYHAALAAEMAFESSGVTACRPMSAMRFLEYGVPWLRRGRRGRPLVIAISASGNTPRVLEAIQRARDHGALTLALTGVAGSPIAELAERCAGIELAAKERSPGIRTFQASLLGLLLVAARLRVARGHGGDGGWPGFDEIADAVEATAAIVAGGCAAVAAATASAPATVVAGSGPSYGTACHAAAKLVEAAGVVAGPQDLEEWWHVDRFAHDAQTPLIIVAPPGRSHWRAVQLAASATERGRRVIAVTQDGDAAMARHAWTVLPVAGDICEELSPLLYHVFAASLACHVARQLGRAPFRGGAAQPPPIAGPAPWTS